MGEGKQDGGGTVTKIKGWARENKNIWKEEGEKISRRKGGRKHPADESRTALKRW